MLHIICLKSCHDLMDFDKICGYVQRVQWLIIQYSKMSFSHQMTFKKNKTKTHLVSVPLFRNCLYGTILKVVMYISYIH